MIAFEILNGVCRDFQPFYSACFKVEGHQVSAVLICGILQQGMYRRDAQVAGFISIFFRIKHPIKEVGDVLLIEIREADIRPPYFFLGFKVINVLVQTVPVSISHTSFRGKYGIETIN